MCALRNCRSVPLSKQPLALVLIQVRFSPITKIIDFIPEIQESFRKNGFPLQSQNEIMTLEVTPQGIRQNKLLQWRFESPLQDSVILVDQEQVTFQTTKYTNFESFIKQYLEITGIVFSITGHDKYGIIVRLGLRYIDQVRKQNENDTLESYLRPALHGMECEQYTDKRKQYTISTIGKTTLPQDLAGTLAIRIIRGERGLDLPPDLVAAAPSCRRSVESDEDLALIDMDHFWDGSLGPEFDMKLVEELFYCLHDTIIEGFHKSVVSEEGIEKWK